MEETVDVLICGGGLVGDSLAAALDAVDLRVLQIEASPPRVAGAARWDERNFALARRTVQSLGRIGVWPLVAAQAQAIRSVLVTSRGDFGAVRVSADDYGFDSVGHTVPARALAGAMQDRLAQCTRLRRWAPARLLALAEVEGDTRAATIEYEGREHVIHARLVVGADGIESFVREAVGIAADRHDYAQTALVATVETEVPAEGRAFERLTETGPFALLPLGDHRCGLVWTVASDAIESLMVLDDETLLARAQARFGARLGRLRRIGQRQTWPLRLMRAHRVIAPRAVLIGNAAQSIHPVGAQGFNLGLRDAMALGERLAEVARVGGDPGLEDILQAHARARGPDREATIRLSDGLVRLFARTSLPVRLARGLGFGVIDRLPGLKQDLAYALMGYRGESPTSRAGADHAA